MLVCWLAESTGRDLDLAVVLVEAAVVDLLPRSSRGELLEGLAVSFPSQGEMKKDETHNS